jgi:two-component system OmpR family response regulator
MGAAEGADSAEDGRVAWGHRRILIVDDDEDHRTVLAEALVAEGYEARPVDGAGAALATLGEWRPDLIILDLIMPDLDQAAFRAEQARRGAADVPILALSAAQHPEALAGGLVPAAVLHKPFDLGHLLETVLDLTRAAGG